MAEPTRIYQEEKLWVEDATSEDWAIAWFRFLTNDKPSGEVWPHFSLSDDEISGLLTATSQTYGQYEYYFPFEAVALRLLSNPEYATSVSEDGYSAAFATAAELVKHMRTVAIRHTKKLYPEALHIAVGLERYTFLFRPALFHVAETYQNEGKIYFREILATNGVTSRLAAGRWTTGGHITATLVFEIN
jgi:hypothetical protein